MLNRNLGPRHRGIRNVHGPRPSACHPARGRLLRRRGLPRGHPSSDPRAVMKSDEMFLPESDQAVRSREDQAEGARSPTHTRADTAHAATLGREAGAPPPPPRLLEVLCSPHRRGAAPPSPPQATPVSQGLCERRAWARGAPPPGRPPPLAAGRVAKEKAMSTANLTWMPRLTLWLRGGI